MVKRNDSCQCTDSSQNLFRSAVTCCKRVINESYEVALSSPGTPSRAWCDSKGDVTSAGTGLLAQRQLDSTLRRKQCRYRGPFPQVGVPQVDSSLRER